MAKKIAPLLPSTAELLVQFGERLRMARLRRHLSAKQVAERGGMAPMTLRSLERGGSGVTMGAYLAVMQVLGIEQDLGLLGKADLLGRELQDARLSPRSSAPQKSPLPRAVLTPYAQGHEVVGAFEVVSKRKRPPKTLEEAPNWIAKSGFASSDALAGLLIPTVAVPKKRR